MSTVLRNEKVMINVIEPTWEATSPIPIRPRRTPMVGLARCVHIGTVPAHLFSPRFVLTVPAYLFSPGRLRARNGFALRG